MSTEQKPEQHVSPHHKEHIETTALGVTLLSGWQKFKQGKLISHRWMGIIIIAVAAIAVFVYIWVERAKERGKQWVELEGANSLSALEKFAENNPSTIAGNVAQMDRARVLIGPEGIDKLPTARDEAERKRAVENIEQARDLMLKLIDEFKDEPILKVECYVGLAKSEAALIGIYKEGSFTESKGSVEKFIEWLDKIGEAADGTPWGDEAKKLSSALKSSDPKVKNELVNVQRSIYTLAPPIAGDGPLAPGRDPFGSGIPGLPSGPFGGGPVVPPISPKLADPKPPEGPKPPDAKPPDGPKPPDPKAAPPKAPETPKAPDPKSPQPTKK